MNFGYERSLNLVYFEGKLQNHKEETWMQTSASNTIPKHVIHLHPYNAGTRMKTVNKILLSYVPREAPKVLVTKLIFH